MKIYTEVVINMETGETVSEESYEYEGPLAECIGGTFDGDGGGSDFFGNDYGNYDNDGGYDLGDFPDPGDTYNPGGGDGSGGKFGGGNYDNIEYTEVDPNVSLPDMDFNWGGDGKFGGGNYDNIEYTEVDPNVSNTIKDKMAPAKEVEPTAPASPEDRYYNETSPVNEGLDLSGNEITTGDVDVDDGITTGDVDRGTEDLNWGDEGFEGPPAPGSVDLGFDWKTALKTTLATIPLGPVPAVVAGGLGGLIKGTDITLGDDPDIYNDNTTLTDLSDSLMSGNDEGPGPGGGADPLAIDLSNVEAQDQIDPLNEVEDGSPIDEVKPPIEPLKPWGEGVDDIRKMFADRFGHFNTRAFSGDQNANIFRPKLTGYFNNRRRG